MAANRYNELHMIKNYVKPKIIVIVGPTASGKTDLAVKLAIRLNSGQAKKQFRVNGAEIISADSRQIYRGMDIGTGKITKKEMRSVPHHLLDIASPKRTFTVAQYQKLGRFAIKKILARGKIPVVVGGTGFYLDALIYDYNLPHVPPNKSLRAKLEKKSLEELFGEFRKLDPRRARNIDRHNKRRLIRALEIFYATGKPIPLAHLVLKRKSPYEIIKIGIFPPPTTLKKNIKRRLLKRMRRGMVAEVRRLRKNGISWQRLDNLGLEYRFIGRYLHGLLTKEEMLQKLEQEIWRYAKRQMTWFKKDKRIRWFKTPTNVLAIYKYVSARGT